jgi:hypothetical protein
MKRASLIVTLLPLFTYGQGANTVVGADLDTSRIRIGEQTTLHLHITHTRGAVRSIQWPTLGDSLNAHVEIVGDSGVDSIRSGQDRLREERTLTITSFDTGFWAIPPFRFIVDGKVLESSPMLLEVLGVELDSAMVPRDIKDIHTLPFSLSYWLREHWPWVASGVGLLALLITAVLLIQRRKRTPVASTESKVVLPLRDRTIAAMRELEKERVWQQGDHKAYHSRLTDLLRGYIEERFQVPALESTTDELIKELRVTSLPAEQRDGLENMLLLADLVKFAKSIPSPQENEQMMNGAIRFVETTTRNPSARDAQE